MKRNILKTVSILLIALAIIFTFTNTAFASTPTTTNTTTASDKTGFESITADSGRTGGADGAITNVLSGILYIAQLIGMGVATIMLLVLAIKYIAASPNDKAEIKKHAVVYIVGAVILFSASGILAIIRNFALTNVDAVKEDLK